LNVEYSCIDSDSDGYNLSADECGIPDCDDSNSSIYPNATEICDDTIDNDCDELIDDEDPDCEEAPAPCGLTVPHCNGECPPGQYCYLLVNGGEHCVCEAPPFDLGDAPDSTNNFGVNMTAYVGVNASFPTVHGGPSPFGPCHLNSFAVLGTEISFENEADINADQDSINNIDPTNDTPDNDSIAYPPAGFGMDDSLKYVPINLTTNNLTLNHCDNSSIPIELTLSGGASESWTAYLNVWIDYNRDGDWGTPSTADTVNCSAPGDTSEWVVQNYAILVPPFGLGTINQTVFFTGYVPAPDSDAWMRIMLTEANVTYADGSGILFCYEDGETEDYYVNIVEAGGPPPPTCDYDASCCGGYYGGGYTNDGGITCFWDDNCTEPCIECSLSEPACNGYCPPGDVCSPTLSCVCITCVDDDSDGYNVTGGGCGPVDCDDSDPSVNPGATEICNNVDDNCDTFIDEGFTNEDCQYVCENLGYVWTGYGAPLNCCGNDEGEASPYEAGTEVSCSDGNDNDCDGLTDSGDPDCGIGPTEISDCTEIPISGEYVLTADITNSSNFTCINIQASDVVLDCQGFTIDGQDLGDTLGIYISSQTNVTIRNCPITDWDVGIFFTSVTYSFLENNTVSSNGYYGVYFSGAVDNNALIGNTFSNNGDIGLYLAGSSNNVLAGNTAFGNANQDVSLAFDSLNNTFTDFTFGSSLTTVDFTYDGDLNLREVTSPPADPDGYQNIGKYVNATGTGWLALNISYTDVDLGSVDENTLFIARNNGSWETDTSVFANNFGVKTTANYVYANVTDFGSLFAPLGNFTSSAWPMLKRFNYRAAASELTSDMHHGAQRVWYQTLANPIAASPAVADINTTVDGLEIAIQTFWSPPPTALIYELSKNGTILCTIDPTGTGNYLGGISSPALANLDNDSNLEGIFASQNNNIYRVQWDSCSVDNIFIPPFPSASRPIYASPAIGDINEDGLNEIAVGASGGGPFYILDENLTQICTFNVSSRSSPAFGDLDTNNSGYEVAFAGEDGVMYVIDDNCNLIWNYTMGTTSWSSPVIENIQTNDTDLEIAVNDDSTLYIFQNDGNLSCSYNMTGDPRYGSPAAAELDYNTSDLEIATGNWATNTVYIVNSSCNLLGSYTASDSVYWTAIADINNDTFNEVLFGSDDNTTYV
ncbi:MAG: MopE-related protein, partial [Candidatus Nanoarchaeia archaeon]